MCTVAGQKPDHWPGCLFCQKGVRAGGAGATGRALIPSPACCMQSVAHSCRCCAHSSWSLAASKWACTGSVGDLQTSLSEASSESRLSEGQARHVVAHLLWRQEHLACQTRAHCWQLSLLPAERSVRHTSVLLASATCTFQPTVNFARQCVLVFV